jgi:phosphoglycerate dehydrogenase-like enzyme
MIKKRPLARSQAPLNVFLVGRVAAKGLPLLKNHLTNRCSLHSFPASGENDSLLAEMAYADVVVSHYFTERMAHAARNLKLLHAVGAGVDAFSMQNLAPQVTVANAFFHGPAIAEYVMMMILALSRNLLKMDSQFRKGIWKGSWIWGDPPAEEIQGKVLGLVGFGHIGREVAARAKAFGMKIGVLSAHPPEKPPKGLGFWKGPERLRQLLARADYVVLACPLNEKTRGLIGRRELSWMKPSAFLVNVARGPIVQEQVLYNALRKRKILGAAIDVWYRYPADESACPASRYPFHELDNVIMTPHVSGWMRGTRERRFQTIAANIDRLVRGQPLLNVIQGPRKHRREGRHS